MLSSAAMSNATFSCRDLILWQRAMPGARLSFIRADRMAAFEALAESAGQLARPLARSLDARLQERRG